ARAARAAAAGAALVKVGFAGVSSARRAARLAAAAVRGAGQSGVILVAYADASRVGALPPAELMRVASGAGARGVLLDTARKNGPSLLALLDHDALRRWVADARAAGLLVALAGKLAPADLPTVRELGADVAGVRGAACEGGRAGTVSAARVRELRALLDAPLDAPLDTRPGAALSAPLRRLRGLEARAAAPRE
ncbi:MAG: (5-formylfuran-3-yl)methyl phosphate synthase, partial [Gemmatimonadaceae bacterium]